MSLSLISNTEENEKFLINTFQDLQDKLSLLSIYETWSYWYPNPSRIVFMRPNLDTNNTSIDVYLSVEVDLFVKAYRKGEIFPISQMYLSDTRQLEILLEEISFSPLNTSETKNINSNDFHITSAQNHIQQAIDNIQANVPEDKLHNCPKIYRLQFINCQLENSLIPKNRRRYNILTQILELKTHLIAPTCYKYLQRMSCL